MSPGLPRVSVASIDEDVLTTLAIYMTQRGQIDLLISILRSHNGIAQPFDTLWLQVAHHLCERNGEKGDTNHHHRELLSLLMRLSDEVLSHSNVPSQIDHTPSQIGPISSQISARSPSAGLISQSGFQSIVQLTVQTMHNMGESHRADRVAKTWKI